MVYRRSEQQLPTRCWVSTGRSLASAHAAAGVDHLHSRSEHSDIGSRLHERHLAFEALGQRDVVGVDARNQIAPGSAATSGQSRRHARVFLTQDSNPWIALRVGSENIGRLVVGAVIDDYELKFPK